MIIPPSPVHILTGPNAASFTSCCADIRRAKSIYISATAICQTAFTAMRTASIRRTMMYGRKRRYFGSVFPTPIMDGSANSTRSITGPQSSGKSITTPLNAPIMAVWAVTAQSLTQIFP